MKKIIIIIATLFVLAASFTSCRSSKPSCAAYDQVELEEVNQ